MSRKKKSTIRSITILLPGYTPYRVELTNDVLLGRRNAVDEVRTMHEIAYNILREENPNLVDPWIRKRRRRKQSASLVECPIRKVEAVDILGFDALQGFGVEESLGFTAGNAWGDFRSIFREDIIVQDLPQAETQDGNSDRKTSEGHEQEK